MTNERFFRMLSVAVMGLLALAVVPQTGASDSQTELMADQLPIEITIVREVDDINAGRFNTALAGEEASLVLSPVKTTTLSQFDPNL